MFHLDPRQLTTRCASLPPQGVFLPLYFYIDELFLVHVSRSKAFWDLIWGVVMSVTSDTSDITNTWFLV